MRRSILSGLILAVALLAILLGWLLWNEPRMIYMPTREIEATPDRLGLGYQDLALVASDGVRIHGWLIPCPPGLATGALDSAGVPRLTVLLLHGNAGNISHRFEKVRLLHACGADVVLVDYRGYGRSEGRPTESGTYRDAEAAYRYLIESRGLDPRSIVLYGESLGGAVAADLASRVEVRGMVIESSFTSIPDVAQAMYPFLPVRWLVRHRYDSVRKLARVRAPVLILHSRDDEYFPLRHGERLAAAAGGGARLVTLRGGHNDAFLVSEDLYRVAVSEFLDELAGRK